MQHSQMLQKYGVVERVELKREKGSIRLMRKEYSLMRHHEGILVDLYQS